MTIKRPTSTRTERDKTRSRQLDRQIANRLEKNVILPISRLSFVESIYLDMDRSAGEGFYTVRVIVNHADEAELVRVWDIEQDAMEADPSLMFGIEVIERANRELMDTITFRGQAIYLNPG